MEASSVPNSEEVKRDLTIQNSKGTNMSIAAGSARIFPAPIGSDRASQEVTSGGTDKRQITSQNMPAVAPTPLPRQSAVGNSSDTGPIPIRPASSDSLDEEESQTSPGMTVTGKACGLLPSKKSITKKDRSKFRKGKWSVEEEEYTSRIIHYFSTGLLTLPEGATLRSYLADKLNCDPMRITKKYAGASCLGRRVFHLRDRAQPTSAEIHLAKAELDHLEQRFRMRVEEGHSGIPMPPHPNMVMSLPQNSQPLLVPNTASQEVAFQSWLMSLATPSGALPSAPAMPGPVSSPAAVWPTAAGPGQWLLPNAVAQPNNSVTMPLTPDPSIHAINDVMKNWAFAQAAASLAPAISHIAIANLQQQQQQQHLQQQQLQQICEAKKSQDQANAKAHALQLKENLKQANAIAHTLQLKENLDQANAKAHTLQLKKNLDRANANDQALQLKENYERYLKTQAIETNRRVAENVASRAPVANKDPTGVPNTINVKVEKPAKRAAPIKVVSGAAKKPRTEEEEAAGTILLGFLSSLRESYEDALVDKQKLSNGLGSIPMMTSRKSLATNLSSNDSLGSGGCDGPAGFFTQKRQAVPVTDSSSGTSHQVESSLDDSDSNSNLKADPSSSEDSDKEANRHRSKGPPRKRMKLRKLADERRASWKL